MICREKLAGIDEGDVTAVVSGVVTSSISLGLAMNLSSQYIYCPSQHSSEFLGPIISGGLAEFFSFPTSAFLFGEVITAQVSSHCTGA